jgi:hypothetical protein
MEYLVLVGGDLRGSLSNSLGDFAPFFWSVVVPVGLAIIWLGGLYALWETWFRHGGADDTGGGGFFKVFFSLFMVTLILCAGAGLEFLVLGEAHMQSRILAGMVDLIRPH